MKTTQGIKRWNRAKKIIPGGTQLVAKRSEMFLPGRWPSYFSKARGIFVWDLDGNRYADMSLMAVGGCILGYADPDVNRAVKNVIDAGSISTLNTPEETDLAQVLLKIHPWAGMVRYARSGGEAMVIAVRIARTFTGKEKVAFCGYHGWHDWYLAANLGKTKKQDGKLLDGLASAGVPRGLYGTALPFTYNNIEELEAIVEANDIGVIAMEPLREHEPKDNFLKKVHAIADRIGAVLIFDEITSGWRMNVGGIHERYGVYPDIVVYAKAISNGFPMAAVIGKKNVMEAAGHTFISSTAWTERTGPAAALATIKKLKQKKVPSHLIAIGTMIRNGWENLAKKHSLTIKTMGIPPLPTLVFDYGKESQAIATLFTQEMLKRGFLTSKTVYVSYAHKKEHVKRYLKNVDEVFGIIKETIEKNSIHKLLKGKEAQQGFRRLT